MTGLWWTSYTYNRALISATQSAVADYEQQAGPYAHESTIRDHDLTKVIDPLFTLRNLPTGYANRDTPLLARWGLSQRERLHASTERAYHVGLERLSRPRLMFRLEEVLNAARKSNPGDIAAGKSNAGDIYEALKVYLMIAGLEHMDRDLVISWMRNDWAERLYPGAGNANGRKALEADLVAMLDLELESGDRPLVEPDLGLIEECRRILARLPIAERAYQLLKSQSRQSIAPDWVASRAGGPDFAAVFEAVPGNGSEISVPGFFTYAGFQFAFIDKIPTIAEQLERDKWALGDIGKLEAFTSQFNSLRRDLLLLYGRDFFPTWQLALNKVHLRSATADRPKYTVLSAAAAPTSPLPQLLESIKNETALTRERSGDKDKKEAPKPSLVDAGAPGAAIEAQFRGFRQVLEVTGSRRTIDGLLGSLVEINNSLQMLSLNPDQKQQTTAALRTQVATLRIQAELFPPPFKEELLRWVREIEGVVVGGTRTEIREEFANSVIPTCALVEGKYPLARGAPLEASPQEFGKVFGKDQPLDSFFEGRLKPYVDKSKQPWAWRKDTPIPAGFSDDTLRQFQRAQNIKDAFFGAGGSQPSFSMAVTPPPLTGLKAKMEINGVPVEFSPPKSLLFGMIPLPTKQSNPPPTPDPVTVQWAGSPAPSRLTITPDSGGTPAVIEGKPPGTAWSFFRLLDLGTPAPRGNGVVVAHYSGYGQVLEYQFVPQTLVNPLLLQDLHEFKCPKVL
jgi:type VI secretion system protein ImpL